MLFDPLPVALGASTGKIVFGSMMIGKFKGFASLKKFFTVAIAVYIAGRMVKDPKNKKMVAIAAVTGTVIQLVLGIAIDIVLVNLTLDDFDTIPGLPESVYFIKGFEAVNDLLFTGVLFCLLPTVYMVPRLHGKIEPLMGMRPRGSQKPTDDKTITPKVFVSCVLGFLAAFGGDYLAAKGLSLADGEGSLLSNTFFVVTIVLVLVGFAVFLWVRQIRERRKPSYGSEG